MILLSRKEKETVELILKNLTVTEISDAMRTNPKTHKFHCTHIYAKFQVSGKTELRNLLTLKPGHKYVWETVKGLNSYTRMHTYYHLTQVPMTLAEIIGSLPEGHTARRDYEVLPKSISP